MDVRVGELFMLGFRGTSLPVWVRKFEASFGLGGLILFDFDVESELYGRNIDSPEQVSRLCAEVHALPSRPLVFVDQEGGSVSRLKVEAGFAEMPSAQIFAGLTDLEKRDLAKASFTQMSELGIDFNLAPVIDLNTNPENPNLGALGRCFSADADAVRRNVLILAHVAQQASLGLCVKHYPGLGGASVDSHKELTDLSNCLTEQQVSLFTELSQVIPGGGILLSHGLVRQWDSTAPVSVSDVAVASLRSRAHDALLISDDLQMDALRSFLPLEEACLTAARAGVDLLCVGNNLRYEEGLCFASAELLLRSAETDPALRRRFERAQAQVSRRKRSAA